MNNIATLTCVIAEDEQIFRDALVQLLAKQWPEIELKALCQDGSEALEALAEFKPDIAFLDIRMPGVNGMDVAAACAELSPATQVVFVTAYNQYAIDAFEKGAIDYLLKPIEPKRLASCIERVKSRAQSGDNHSVALQTIMAQLTRVMPVQTIAEPMVWLTASTGKESKLIMIEDVLYFQSDSKYTTVVTVEGEALLRTPLRDLIDKLDSNQFKQIHRATIVNIKAIAAISRDEIGRGTLKLKARPETLSVSITYMPLFRNM